MSRISDYPVRTKRWTGDRILGTARDGTVQQFPIDSFGRRIQFVGTRGQLPINVEGAGVNNYTRFESQIITRIGRFPAFDIRVMYANFYAASGAETLGPNDFTLSAAFLRPSFGTAVPFVFGAAKNPVIGSGSGLIVSNPIGMDLEANSDFIIRSGAVVASTEVAPGGLKLKSTNDKMFSSTAVSSQVYTNATMTAPGGGAQSTYGFSPTAILGVFEEATPSFLIWGDSIAYGQDDTNDGNGNSGWVERGLWNVYESGAPVPFCNMSRSGDRLAGNGKTVAVLKRGLIPYATHVIVQLGTNDVSNGDSLATIQTNATAVFSSIRRQGARVIACKILPKTTAANNTTIFSTPYQPGGIRDLYNDWLDDLYDAGTIDGVIDPNSALEDPNDHGHWISSAVSSDGLHLNSTGAALAAAVMKTFAQSCSI